MKNVIFIAPPAAGKGTISEYLVDNYNYTHLSTGDMLREITKEDTELGKNIAKLISEGKFINDDIMFKLIENKLQNAKEPFILDGIPRNYNQAEYLTKLFNKLDVNNYVVINIDIDKDILLKRAVGRKICPNCKASYNIYFEEFKPKVENTCDKCNVSLIKRDDDNENTFNERYKTYIDMTKPILSYYDNLGILKTIDANKSKEEIVSNVVDILKE